MLVLFPFGRKMNEIFCLGLLLRSAIFLVELSSEFRTAVFGSLNLLIYTCPLFMCFM